MDILQARDSLSSEGDHLFYSSDEFMAELLMSPIRHQEALEALEESLFTNTSKALEIMQAPPSEAESKNIRKSMFTSSASHSPKPEQTPKLDLRQHLKKEASFCSNFKNGVTVKPKAPQKGKQQKKNENDDSSSSSLSFSPKPQQQQQRSPKREQPERPKVDLRQQLHKEAAFNSKLADGAMKEKAAAAAEKGKHKNGENVASFTPSWHSPLVTSSPTVLPQKQKHHAAKKHGAAAPRGLSPKRASHSGFVPITSRNCKSEPFKKKKAMVANMPFSHANNLDFGSRSERYTPPTSPHMNNLDFASRSDRYVPPPSCLSPLPPAPIQEAKSFDSSDSEWSDDLSESSSIAPSPVSQSHPPLSKVIDSRIQSGDEDKIPPPPPTMTSYSPYNNALNKRAERNSASAREERMRRSSSARMVRSSCFGDAPPSPLSKSTQSNGNTKHLSWRDVEYSSEYSSPMPSPSIGSRRRYRKAGGGWGQSPVVRDTKPAKASSWLVTPNPTPPPRPRRTKSTGSNSKSSSSSKGNSRRRSHVLMSGIPKMPFMESTQEEEKQEETAGDYHSPSSSPTNTSSYNGSSSSSGGRGGPPLFRPLDKILTRDYPSTTTATTFLTADTDAVDYSMSHMFPITKETERIVFRKTSTNKRKDLIIETPSGEKLGMIDYSMVNQGKRLIKDSVGRTCALIIVNGDKLKGKKVFKICGNKPASRKQRLSNETGFYTWAEVRNSGSMGGKFVMNRFNAETSTCTAEPHSTKPFGSLFVRGKNSRGQVFLDDHKKECVKMVSLEKGKGIIVGPNRDLCLMLCYAAIVEEMLDYRLR